MRTRKSKQLQSLARIYQQREQQALHAFATSTERSNQRRTQLSGLKSYREEYTALMLKGGQRAMNAGQLKDLHRFLAKLDAAIIQGGRRTSEADAQYLEDRRCWLQAHTRTQLVEKLLQRQRRVASVAAEGRAQKQLDDYAQRWPQPIMAPDSNGEGR